MLDLSEVTEKDTSVQDWRRTIW